MQDGSMARLWSRFLAQLPGYWWIDEGRWNVLEKSLGTICDWINDSRTLILAMMAKPLVFDGTG